MSNLSPGLTRSSGSINLDQPSFGSSGAFNANVSSPTFQADPGTEALLATGGPVQSFDEGSSVEQIPTSSPTFGYEARITHGRPMGALSLHPHFQSQALNTPQVTYRSEGGDVHVPEFYSEGGLKHRYVKGKGDGTSDDVPAMLANGEFVIPADVVSDLGNGSNQSGAKVLDSFLSVIRAHKQKHDPSKLPPDSKGPLAYLLAAKKKAKV